MRVFDKIQTMNSVLYCIMFVTMLGSSNLAFGQIWVDRSAFFDGARSSVHKKGLTQIQVDVYNQVLGFWEKNVSSKDVRWLAYVLGTTFHESRSKPVREGFCPTDSCSRKAVKRLYLKGRIKRNYAAAHPITGKSYYGRGFVQLTHAGNYKRLGKAIGLGDKLYLQPDLALDPKIATEVLWVGMIDGLFRSRKNGTRHKLADYFTTAREDWKNARRIVNGDTKKNGLLVARHSKGFLSKAIKLSSVAQVNENLKPPDVMKELEDEGKPVEDVKNENTDLSSDKKVEAPTLPSEQKKNPAVCDCRQPVEKVKKRRYSKKISRKSQMYAKRRTRGSRLY